MIPLILSDTSTNERPDRLNSGEKNITRECIDKLLERTKRRGRGEALKTILAEAEAKKGNTSESRGRKDGESSSEDDTPRRLHSTQTASSNNA